MDKDLIGKTVIIVNPMEEHKWAKGREGSVIMIDAEHFSYIVSIHQANGVENLIRMTRGEFDIKKTEE